MSECLFSIIIPIYNVEKYLPECIESILSQDFKDFEIIAVNDGSKDNSGKIIDDYAKKDGRIKVIHKENGGLVSARKAGAEKATGKYILNVDSDDFLEPGALKIISNQCFSTNADVVCFSFYRYFPNNKTSMLFQLTDGIYNTNEKLSEIYEKVIYSDESPFFRPGIYPSLCTKAIKREIYVESQLSASNDVSMGEDLMVWLPVAFKANSICLINKPLYNYRENENSLTMKYRHKEFNELLSIIGKIKETVDISLYNIEQQLDAYIFFRFYSICMAEFMYGKSYMQTRKKVNEYYNELKKYFCKKDIPWTNRKYKIIRFVTKNRIWIYFFLNSLRLKKKLNYTK